MLVTLGTGTVEELHLDNMTVDDEPPPAAAWAWDGSGEVEAQGAFRHVRVAACAMQRLLGARSPLAIGALCSY